MAVNNIVTSILECPICMEELREPKTLPCNHSFCKRCLANIVKSKYANKDGSLKAPTMMTSIRCPTCKAQSKFCSLDDLGTIYIINQLLEAQVEQRGGSQKVLCLCMCGKSAKMRCHRCSYSCCNQCYKAQNKPPCLVQDFGLNGFMQEHVMRHIFIMIPLQEDDCDCIDHSLPLDLFCSDCRQAICMNCFLLNHNHHQCKLIGYAREVALELVNGIKIIRLKNADGYDHLYQIACNVSESAINDEEIMLAKLEDVERRVNGLISSIFKKAKSFYSYKSGIRKNASEEAICFCDSPKPIYTNCDFNDRTDFELACLVEDLLNVKNRTQEEANNIGKKISAMKQHMLQKCTDEEQIFNEKQIFNEEQIFNSLLGIFEDVKLGSKHSDVFLPHSFTFAEYLKGKYIDDITH